MEGTAMSDSLRSGSPEGHPELVLLERFMRDNVEAPERMRVVRHLLAGCPQCVAVTRRLWALAGGMDRPLPPLLPESSPTNATAFYAAAFERAESVSERREREMATEWEAAPRLLADLLEKPWDKRLAMVRRNERYQTLALAVLLLDHDRLGLRSQEGGRPVSRAERLALLERSELALAIGERLDPAVCGPSVVRDLLGRAWTQVGEDRRQAGDLPGAERAVLAAAPFLRGMAAAERLDLLRLEAALAADRGHFEEADALLERAAESCRSAGEPHLEGSVRIERGTLHAGCGHYGSAIDLLHDGALLLDGESDPALLASALHRRAALLVETGRAEAALDIARSLYLLYQRLDDRIGLLRLRWLCGKVEEDETALLGAREGFLAEGRGLAAAQVSLDLAVVYARRGRWGEIRRLAEEIFPIFKTRDLRQESMAALLVFRRAVETESASLEFLVEVAGYLLGSRRSRWGAL
jgi:tetratricopeptide (TPR) repeat protein